MYKFKLNHMEMTEKNGGEKIHVKKINVIIGPNNSGKSRFLKEIGELLNGNKEDKVIVKELGFNMPKDRRSLIESYDIENKIYSDIHKNLFLKAYANREQFELDMNSSFDSYFSRNAISLSSDWEHETSVYIKTNDRMNFLSMFGQLFYQYLGTEERLTICKTQRSHGLDSNMVNFLSSLRLEQNILNEMAEITKDLFGRDVYLDGESLGDKLVFRTAKDFSYIRESPRSDTKVLRELLEYNKLDYEGDGLKSFVSMYLSLRNKDKNVVIIDEPEAFLHPPLARKVGGIIGEIAESDSFKSQIFISTHSVEILKGILSKTDKVNIIRITRPTETKNDIRVVDNNVLKGIMRDPLLRVSRVMEGLFCEKVIITESEADELLYQELVTKLDLGKRLYFAHGQNKQTLSKIANLYNSIGVDYSIVVDFDIIRVWDELRPFIKIMGLEKSEVKKLQNTTKEAREFVESQCDTSDLSNEEIKGILKRERNTVYHKRGLDYFNSNNELYNRLKLMLEEFSNNKLFVLSSGELETAMNEFGLTHRNNKAAWIVDALMTVDNIEIEALKQSKLYSFILGFSTHR